MKRIYITLAAILLIAFMLQAQDMNNSVGQLGVTFSSLGENDVYLFNELDGAASYIGDGFFSLGINYIKPVKTWLEFETGLEYEKHNILVKPNLPPDADNSIYNSQFSLLNIPVTLRVNLLKYFFINGGLFLDMDIDTSSPIDSQTGVGGLFGIAVKYDFDFGVSIFMNPYSKFHSLLPFSMEDYHQKVYESGIRFGISYNLTCAN